MAQVAEAANAASGHSATSSESRVACALEFVSSAHIRAAHPCQANWGCITSQTRALPASGAQAIAKAVAAAVGALEEASPVARPVAPGLWVAGKFAVKVAVALAHPLSSLTAW